MGIRQPRTYKASPRFTGSEARVTHILIFRRVDIWRSAVHPPEVELGTLFDCLDVSYPVRFWFQNGTEHIQAHFTKARRWELIATNSESTPEELLEQLDSSEVLVLARGFDARTVTTGAKDVADFPGQVFSLHHLCALYHVQQCQDSRSPNPPTKDPINITQLYRELRRLSLKPFWRNIGELLKVPPSLLHQEVASCVPELVRFLAEMQRATKRTETLTKPQFLQIVALLTNIISKVRSFLEVKQCIGLQTLHAVVAMGSGAPNSAIPLFNFLHPCTL